MDAQLCQDLDRLVEGQVESGRYARREDVIQEVRDWLLERGVGPDPGPPPAKRPMSIEEFRQHLLQTGRVSQLPSADRTDRTRTPWEPIDIDGEPVSQTILRERR